MTGSDMLCKEDSGCSVENRLEKAKYACAGTYPHIPHAMPQEDCEKQKKGVWTGSCHMVADKLVT